MLDATPKAAKYGTPLPIALNASERVISVGKT